MKTSVLVIAIVVSIVLLFSLSRAIKGSSGEKEHTQHHHNCPCCH